jgi:lysophospholipase
MDVVDHLIELPGDPTPPGARCGLVTTPDGLRLRWAGFDAPRPRGTVILLQGRAEFIECYYETIRDLQARGLSVLTFDWRGQGGSERLLAHPRKGHVATMAAYDFDLDAVLRLVAPKFPKPWYALAHSTGGLVAVANGARLARDVRRLVLTAPFLGLGRVGGNETVARLLARGLRLVGLGRDWVPGGGETPIHTTPFAANVLTSDPERHARGAELSWCHKELAIGSATIGWLAAAFDAMDRIFVPEVLAAWRLPTLIFACGDDRVVSNAAIERFATRTTATDLLVIPGARHELLKERDRYREQFWAAFDAFVPGSDAPAVDLPPSSARPVEPPPPPVLAAITPVAEEPADPHEAAAAQGPAGTPETPIAETETLRRGEEGEHLLVQPRIAGGDDTAAVDGAAAGPGGDDAAGPLDHRDQRDDVVGLEPGLDHHVDETGRDHAVGVAVDPVARQPDP